MPKAAATEVTIEQCVFHIGEMGKALEAVLVDQETERKAIERHEQMILGLLQAVKELGAIIEEVARGQGAARRF